MALDITYRAGLTIIVQDADHDAAVLPQLLKENMRTSVSSILLWSSCIGNDVHLSSTVGGNSNSAVNI